MKLNYFLLSLMFFSQSILGDINPFFIETFRLLRRPDFYITVLNKKNNKRSFYARPLYQFTQTEDIIEQARQQRKMIKVSECEYHCLEISNKNISIEFQSIDSENLRYIKTFISYPNSYKYELNSGEKKYEFWLHKNDHINMQRALKYDSIKLNLEYVKYSDLHWHYLRGSEIFQQIEEIKDKDL